MSIFCSVLCMQMPWVVALNVCVPDIVLRPTYCLAVAAAGVEINVIINKIHDI